MIIADEIRLTEIEATNTAYGDSDRRWVNPMAVAKRGFVANPQFPKEVWTIVNQLRTLGTLQGPSMDDMVATAILEQIAIILRSSTP